MAARVGNKQRNNISLWEKHFWGSQHGTGQLKAWDLHTITECTPLLQPHQQDSSVVTVEELCRVDSPWGGVLRKAHRTLMVIKKQNGDKKQGHYRNFKCLAPTVTATLDTAQLLVTSTKILALKPIYCRFCHPRQHNTSCFQQKVERHAKRRGKHTMRRQSKQQDQSQMWHRR